MMIRFVLFGSFISICMNLSKAPAAPGAVGELPRTGSTDGQAQAGGPSEASPADRSAAEWLVLLARHEGQLEHEASSRGEPRKVALQVQSLLDAARMVSPQCAEAYYWLYDIHARAGRRSEALMALAKYSSLTPEDETARLVLLNLELERLQTAEARAEFLQSELKVGDLPRSIAAEVHYRLGRHYQERHEFEPATRELEQALRLNPLHLEARRLAYELFDETDDDLQRVEAALQLLTLNPSQVAVAWELGELLDRLSLHRPAQDWYQRAIDLHRRAGGGPVRGEYWHRIALSYLNSGDFEKARQAAESALGVSPPHEGARLVLVQALRGLRDPRAEDELRRLRTAYERGVEGIIAGRRFDDAAEAAWFFAYHSPDAERAMRLARVAMTQEPPSDLAKLALGRALYLSGKHEDAAAMLEPLSARDQFAALCIAEIQIARGRKAEAATILQKGATVCYSGIAYEQIRGMLESLHEEAPKCPPRPRVLAALDGFPKELFDFHVRPQEFVSLEIQAGDAENWPVGLIPITIRVKNTSSFQIGLGEGMILRPLVVVQAEVDDGPSFPRLLTTLVNSRPVLRPGESVERRIAVNVGPLREYLISHSRDPRSIRFTALLDPVFEQGEPAALIGTVTSNTVVMNTSAIGDTPTAIASMISRAGSAITAERIEAADQIGSLICSMTVDSERAGGNPPRLDELQTAMARLLSDADWKVRSRALVAAGWTRLDPRTTVAAAPCVRDENAVVKLLAVRLFAEQHGEKFRMPLEQLSRVDSNPWVRMMAESFLPEASVSAETDENPGQ